MIGNLYSNIAGLFFSLLSTFLFTMIRSAFFSLSEEQAKKLQARNHNAYNWLINRPHILFSTLSLGSVLSETLSVLFNISIWYYLGAIWHWGTALIWIFGLTTTIFTLILLDDVLPRMLVTRFPLLIVFNVSGILQIISIISIFPWLILAPLFKQLNTLITRDKRSFFWLRDELLNLGGEDNIDEILEADEQKMISSIFELGGTIVKEVMIPRIDMECVDITMKIDDFLDLVKETGHSRYPTYKTTVDEITGIIYTKDVLLAAKNPNWNKELSLKDMSIRNPYFIPETKKVDNLLRELKKNKMHIAIVVDEHGGTAGLVTLEDLIEEIVGEIFDEYDVEEILFKKIDEKHTRVEAKTRLEEINEELDLKLPDKDFETLSGFIYDLVGKVPEEGEKIQYNNINFTVEKVEGQRISTVIISQCEDKKDA